MNRSVLLKLFLCLLVVGWAVSSILPLKDRPFDSYLLQRANQQTEQLATIVHQAQEGVSSNKAPSLIVALKAIGAQDTVDYAQFFKDLSVVDVKNLKKRNDIVLNHLFQESQASLKQGLDLRGGVGFTLAVGKSDVEASQLEQAIAIIRKRIDSMGLSEPLIRARGTREIEVQLPGLSLQQNPDALAALKKPAKLEFRLVHEDTTLRPGLVPVSQYPSGYEAMTLESNDPVTGETRHTRYFVKRIPALTGKALKNAFVTLTPTGSYEIGLSFTPEGTEQFARVTQSNVGRQLAIVLDKELYSAPMINTPITGGHATISGDFSYRTALELASVLNNPLEVELSLQELYDIGPSLAEEARSKSIQATLLGAGLVIVFMIVYYASAGVIAVISVLLNVLIVLAVLAALGATLTLPGIAGLVLTIGMGVDANILIFERIREELKNGKSLSAALLAGHERAFSTILDANLTTLMTAAILIWLGTGPIKGFGVTLAIGIGASMFCVLFASRLLLELWTHSRPKQKLFSFCLFKDTQFSFIRYGRIACIVSWLMIAGTLWYAYSKGDAVYGIDFAGGEELSIRFDTRLPIQTLTEIADSQALGSFIASYQKSSQDTSELLKIQTELGQGTRYLQALNAAYPDAGFTLIGESTIGASVSQTLKTDALLAVGVSLLGILAYVAFRFELGFGIGAVVSTIHDILLTLGIFLLMGGQMTASMVAALLMVIGYSINDTIVVFDRIREELKLSPTLSLQAIIDDSINKTLSRTLLTSLTTALATLALYIFGAGPVHDFAWVFLIGIIVGTFSSIFVASPIFYWWHKGDRRHAQQHTESTSKYIWDADV